MRQRECKNTEITSRHVAKHRVFITPVICEKRLPEETAWLRQEEQVNRKGRGIPDRPLQVQRPLGSPRGRQC